MSLLSVYATHIRVLKENRLSNLQFTKRFQYSESIKNRQQRLTFVVKWMHYKGRVKMVISYNFTYSLLGDVTVYSMVHKCQCFREVCYFCLHYYPLYQEWEITGTSTKSTQVILACISDMHTSLQLNSIFHTEFYQTTTGISSVVILWINIFVCIIIHNNEIHTSYQKN